ncbi:hypothetical protein [Aquimarina aggregata]|uniref:hypothetical protein n=1 Tax=Aquimarina aggregata TaxID=1642818 RepID=UPI0024916BF8|nr:hypothetical protein [Aquimarina aggregata]
MNTKKNIDRLFQEKFKDFEVSPSDEVWKKIQARQNKRKRKIIPVFWYKTAGVAAVFAIIFTVGYVALSPTPNEVIVLQNNTVPKDMSSPNDVTPTTKNNNITSTTIDTDKNITSDHVTENNKETISNEKKEDIFNKNQKTIVKYPNKAPVAQQKTNDKGNSNKPNIMLVQGASKTAKESNNSKVDNTLRKEITDNVVSTEPNLSKTKNDSEVFLAPNKKDDLNTKAPIAKLENTTNSNNSITKKHDSINEEETKIESAKKSIFDVISDQKEAIAEKEEKEEKTNIKKWNISPNVAPVYYNAIGNGSSIAAEFSDNDRGGEVNLSYGIQVSYAINNKLSIRSGVHKLDLSYNTKDIGFSASSSRGQNLESINYNNNASSILVSDIGRGTGTNDFSETIGSINQQQNVGLLNQRIGYIEVPVEMKYALVDTKFGVHMIGGLSTLFVRDNEISIEAGSFESPIGEANNLNDISFSGNIGLGLDYKISNQLKINLEPIFKYQFNAFNDNADGFKPYYFGIYTGLGIKF